MPVLNVLEERAAPKINLTLEIVGHRPDGYHELRSLVAFSTGGDRLSLHLGEPEGLVLSGPWAVSLQTETTRNLVLRALDAVRAQAPGARGGRFRLEKNLPVASGIGGGSADAAAALRILRRANPEIADAIDWPALAANLGADVPVCLEGRAAIMSGIGHRLAPLEQLPAMPIVLVNPAVPLATAEVFRALNAPPAPPETPPPSPLPALTTPADVLAYLRSSRNDLEPAARSLCPAIGNVLGEVSQINGVMLARMSGSGPTCFGVFESLNQAKCAAEVIAARHPAWWVQAGFLC